VRAVRGRRRCAMAGCSSPATPPHRAADRREGLEPGGHDVRVLRGATQFFRENSMERLARYVRPRACAGVEGGALFLVT